MSKWTIGINNDLGPSANHEIGDGTRTFSATKVDAEWLCERLNQLAAEQNQRDAMAQDIQRLIENPPAPSPALVKLFRENPPEPVKVYVVHVYDGADQQHGCYVHATLKEALRQAAIDVVNGRFEGRDFDGKKAEIVRVLRTVQVEPDVCRGHVRCDAWRAHVDEMQVLP
jgi:hypothetical protein